MLNKKDPLIDAIKQVMQNNQADRDAVKAVNEKFGIQDRRVLPRERQGEWDAAYKTVLTEGVEALDEKSFAALAPPYDKATHKDKLVGAGVLKKHPTEPGKHVLAKEEKKMKGDDPCWDTHKMVGMKKGKGGKPVPNCVPVKEQDYSATQPSKMGLKPDYATGTPDYAKSKEQTVNRDAKTSLPPGTMKEEEQIQEKAPPGAKYERMVKHIKNKMSKGGLTKKEKSIAYATSWKAKKKDVNEGFNNRRDSSVTASAEKQVVAGLNEAGGPNPAVVKKQQAAARIANRPKAPNAAAANASRLANLRRSAQPLDKRDTALDNPSTESPMARATNPNIGGAGGVGSNFGTQSGSGSTVPKNLTRAAATVASKVQSRPPMGGGGKNDGQRAPIGGGGRNDGIRTAMGGGGRREGRPQGAPAPSNTTSIADKPKMTQASTTTQPDYDKMTFKQAFSSARKQASGAGGKFKYKGKEYQTNIKGTGTSSKPQEKYQASNKLKSVAPAPQTQTKTSVTGGQGISAFSSSSTSRPSIPAQNIAKPTARPTDVSSTGPARPTMATNTQAAGQMAVDRMKRQSSLASNKIDTQWQKGPDTSFNARYNYGGSQPNTQKDVRSPSNPERVANPTFVPQRISNRQSSELGQEISSTLAPRVDAKAQGVQLPARTTQSGGGRNDGASSSTSGTSTAFGGSKIASTSPINNLGRKTQ